MTDSSNYFPADHPTHAKQTVTNDAVAGEPVIDNGHYAGATGSEPLEAEPEMAENELGDDIDLAETPD